ncbi:transcription factor PRE6-like protein [Tanacetum coccineum]
MWVHTLTRRVALEQNLSLASTYCAWEAGAGGGGGVGVQFPKNSGAKVLEETCSYVRRLQREVDDLSQRLSELLRSMDTDSPQAAISRNLLMSP